MTKKVLISAFAVLNIATVLYANCPSRVARSAKEVLERRLSPWGVYRVRHGGWILSRYAHLTGLDNRWQMFGRQARFNWWFRIQGVRLDGSSVDLPLPLQSERSFAQRNFFDFREGKYHNSLYVDKDLRIRYARYLCRTFPAVAGNTTLAVRFVLHHQMLLAPEVARSRGTHLEAESYSRQLDEVPCAPKS